MHFVLLFTTLAGLLSVIKGRFVNRLWGEGGTQYDKRLS